MFYIFNINTDLNWWFYILIYIFIYRFFLRTHMCLNNECQCCRSCQIKLKSPFYRIHPDVWWALRLQGVAVFTFINQWHLEKCIFWRTNILQDINKKNTTNNKKMCRNIEFFWQIDTNTQGTKNINKRLQPCRPALSCASCGRRNINIYTHARVTSTSAGTQEHDKDACRKWQTIVFFSPFKEI